MGSLLGSQINPVTPPPMVGTGTQTQFFQSLFGQGLGSNNEGYGYIKGMPGYQGDLSPNSQNTILPQVYQNWQPWNAGTGYMADYLQNGAGPNAGVQQSVNNLNQYGGVGGYPTQLMTGMAQYGGTGGPGNKAMSSMLQFGAPSAAGQGVANMAQTGVSGSWGNQLLARASGQQTPASQYLAPFLQGATPYRANWSQK